MAYKRYRSLFSERSGLNRRSKINIQEKIRRILREKSLTNKDIDSIVGKIEGVITDVISNYGVDNPLVDELSNTVKNINSYGSSISAQNAVINQSIDMEEKFKRSQRKLRENMYDMDAPMDIYNDDSMYVSDMDDYGMESEMGYGMDDVYDADPMAVDEFGFDVNDSGLYENRRGKINRLSRKLREGEEADDFITDSEDIVDEDDEMEMEDDEMEMEDDGVSVTTEEDDEAEEPEEEDEDLEQEGEESEEEGDDDEEKEEAEEAEIEESDDEDADDAEKKEAFRRRMRRESRSRRPMRAIRGSYREEAESEEGEDIIPMDNGSDYDFLDGIDTMGSASSERSMTAKYDYRKGM
jgi:hypothetical protein